jgi:hypothetical protein
LVQRHVELIALAGQFRRQHLVHQVGAGAGLQRLAESKFRFGRRLRVHHGRATTQQQQATQTLIPSKKSIHRDYQWYIYRSAFSGRRNRRNGVGARRERRHRPSAVLAREERRGNRSQRAGIHLKEYDLVIGRFYPAESHHFSARSDASMPLLALGLNHRTAPVAIRERIAFAPERLDAALRRFARLRRRP